MTGRPRSPRPICQVRTARPVMERDFPRRRRYGAAMRVVPSALPEVVIIEPDVHRDARGFFFEAYHTERYRAAGIVERFVQDNHARSVRGTLRGLHGQRRHPQGKLVRATLGQVFDVAVDIREGSPRRGQWVGVRLSAEDHRQVYIPPGFLHGYCVLTDAAEIEYKCTVHYDPA